MKCLVTGAAGFIGSHLCERLLQLGHSVVAIDAFIPYYPQEIKEANLASFRKHPACSWRPLDLRHDDLRPAVQDVEAVFHLAAMPGLAKSWTDFDLYESCNVIGTHRLLEAVRHAAGLKCFIYASTSSVYGRYASGDESIPTRPISPYGVTKLAAENLCRAHAEELGLPLVVLRYFSVYGPRQRPDMGYHRFVRALLDDQTIVIYGDGFQIRGNTYIDDCIDATVRALQALPGEIYNVGGGEAATVWEIIHKLEALTGKRAQIRQEGARPGDQRHTGADTSKLLRHLGWRPQISLDEGLGRQIAWQREAK